MPLYSYMCDLCHRGRTDIRTIENRHKGPTCDFCRGSMRLLIDAVAGVVKDPAVPKERHPTK
jgi:putative FmdB family regulatory protein